MNKIKLIQALLLAISYSLTAASPLYRKNHLPPDSGSVFQSLLLPESKKQTGVLSLEVGGNSLVTRLWLLKQAKHTVDIQYFSFARNITGLVASEYLIRAADRGVKIRLLIDELSGKLNAREVKILDRHDNIEVRVYNAGVKLGRPDKKVKYTAKNINRLTRRMHNKSLIVDEESAIIGGRNISDEYFDVSDKFNFRDRDVLLLGDAAKQIGKSFNDFWESKYTVTVKELVGETDKKFSVDALFSKLHEFSADTAQFSTRVRELVDSFPNFFKNKERAGDFQWVENVSFVSDVPGKNEEREGRKGGLCDDTIISLIKSAKTSIDVHTPYFITMEEARVLLKETADRGVKIRILTNSLASIDNNVAFSPYKRDRKKNLATGIEIYEFRPDAAVRFHIMRPEIQSELHYDPIIGLHSKTIVIDGKVAVIGSYNLEPRSVNLNTECVVVIRSKEITEKLLHYMETEFLPENSWKITEKFNPDKKASFKKRFMVFMGHVVPKQTL